MNLPNKLTMLRILLVPFFVVFVYFEKYPVCQVLALVLFISASITDLLDGRIARSRNLVTDFGKFMDPIADKLLVMSAFVMLVEQQRMPGWVCILMLAREFIISGLRLVAAGNGRVIAAGKLGKTANEREVLAKRRDAADMVARYYVEALHDMSYTVEQIAAVMRETRSNFEQFLGWSEDGEMVAYEKLCRMVEGIYGVGAMVERANGQGPVFGGEF